MSDNLGKIIELAEQLKGLAESTSVLTESVTKALVDVCSRISNLEHAAALSVYHTMQPGPPKGRVYKLINEGKKLKLVFDKNTNELYIEAQE